MNDMVAVGFRADKDLINKAKAIADKNERALSAQIRVWIASAVHRENEKDG